MIYRIICGNKKWGTLPVASAFSEICICIYFASFSILQTRTNCDYAFVFCFQFKGSDSFSLIAASNGDPRCDVRERDLDLYISHFSEWWIVAFITKVFVGKRVICTPFVPEPSPMDTKHLLRLCIRDSNQGKAEVCTGRGIVTQWHEFTKEVCQTNLGLCASYDAFRRVFTNLGL